MAIWGIIKTLFTGKTVVEEAIVPGIKTLLDMGNKNIVDKSEKLEYEKKLLEVNEQIIKSNRKLLDKIVPITFPLVTWCFTLIPTIAFFYSLWRFHKTGTFFEIPLPLEWLEKMFYIVLVFITALGGKWNNINEIWKSKK